MDTMNISHVDNPVGTPPPIQCSRPDEDNKRPYLSSSNAMPSSSTDPAPTTHTPPTRSSSSPPPSCAICLGSFVNKCMPDICLHQFCFNCLLQWSKVKAVCPLCKRPFLSIIHNVRSNYEYDEHVIERPQEQEYYLPNAPQPRHFQFRTTFTVDPRGELAIQQMLSSHPLTFPLGIYEPFTHRLHRHADRPGRVSRSDRRSYVSSTAYRRSIYEQGLWVVANPDGADMHREATPDFYRNNEGAIARLVPWLNRELSVLMQHASTEQVANLIDQILAALPRHHILSRYMLRDVLQPYLHLESEHFAHEFYNYMRSPLDMIGYDRSCIHGPRVIENVNLDDQTSSDSSDSTVQLLDNHSTSNDRFRFPLFVPAPLPADQQATTSFQPQAGTSAQVSSNVVIEIDDSDGNDSDVILQTPPPPTIVDLLGDTSESEGDVDSGLGVGVRLDQQQQQEEDTPTTTLASAIRQSLLLDTSSVQEVDSNEAGPSTSHGARKRKNRCYGHDEYTVDRKTVLPLKIRLKRKRHYPSSRRSCSKSKHCCKNGATGGYRSSSSSSSSNDTSLQSRLKRRKMFHKKKYYLRKQSSSSSSSSRSSSSSSKSAKGMFSFSSSDDDEPLASAMLRNRVKTILQPQIHHVPDSSGAVVASTSGTGSGASRLKMKRELRGRLRQNGGVRSGVPPPGVFEPSVPCPSPLISASPSSSESRSHSRPSSRYTPDLLVSRTNASHFAHYSAGQPDHPALPPPRGTNNQFLDTLYRATTAHLYPQQTDSRESHTPPYSPHQRGYHRPTAGTIAAGWEVAGPSTVNQQELRDPMWNGLRNREQEDGGSAFCARAWIDKEPYMA